MDGWGPLWQQELRWINIGLFLLFILTWFWFNRRRGSDTTVRPILLFHFITPVMILSATWSPLPFIWFTLLLSLCINQELHSNWKWLSLLPGLVLGWFFPSTLFFLPALFVSSFQNLSAKVLIKRTINVAGLLVFVVILFSTSTHSEPNLELVSQFALRFGWANLVIIGLLIFAAIFGSLKTKENDPVDALLLWMTLPVLTTLPLSKSYDEALFLFALPFPFLLGLIARHAFFMANKPLFALTCLAFTISHLPLAHKISVPKNDRWFYVDWAANAEKSRRLKTLMDTLEKEMGDMKNVILTSSDKKSMLGLLSRHPVLAFPANGPSASYSHLHQAGFWVLEKKASKDDLDKAKTFLGGLGFWRQVSIGRSEQHRQEFWIYRFDQLKIPF